TSWPRDWSSDVCSSDLRQVVNGAENLTTAVRKALLKVRGSYAFVVMSDKEPGTLVCAKNSSPLVIGLGNGENFIASDVTAILARSEERRVGKEWRRRR